MRFIFLFVFVFSLTAFSAKPRPSASQLRSCLTAISNFTLFRNLSADSEKTFQIVQQKNKNEIRGKVLAIDLFEQLVEALKDEAHPLHKTFQKKVPTNSTLMAEAHASPSVQAMRREGQGYSAELLAVLQEAHQIAQNDKSTYGIQPRHLLTALLKVYPQSTHAYFESVGITQTRAGQIAKTIMISDPQVTAVVESLTKQSMGKDLTEEAANGVFQPFYGRGNEVDRLIEILGQQIKNNALILGEPGVGKTAIVEELAKRLADGDVPPFLQGKHVLTLELGNLVAGTRYRGDVEEKLRALLANIEQTDKVILFVDEIHALKEIDPSILNMLLAPLARKKITMIAATTNSSYQKHLSNLSGFPRRFDIIRVEPLDEAETIAALNQRIPDLLKVNHQIKLSEDATTWAARWAKRFIPDVAMPDSAMGLLDSTIAMVGREGGATVGKAELAHQLEKRGLTNYATLMQDASARVETSEVELNKKVIGQLPAVAAASKVLVRAAAGMNDPNRPLGTLLFLGPTGVGKTELATALAKLLGEQLIRFDMSEYMEKHSVAKLIGAPPGYVGYGESAALYEAAKRYPTGVILLDEIEKAHPDVLNILLQSMDEGHLTNGSGQKVSLKNNIIIMTSNATSQNGAKPKRAIGYAPQKASSTTQVDADRADLVGVFTPEFLGRIDVVQRFNSLDSESIELIVAIKLGSFFEQLALEKKITVTPTSEVIKHLATIGSSKEFGGRDINRVLNSQVRDLFAMAYVTKEIKDGDTVTLTYDAPTKSIKISK